ncbi:MAG TPA: xanthine dehydrogenase family protein molybdopterin-binding subunit [Candidatus Binatia bacterium]
MVSKVEALRVVGQPVARKDGRDIVTGNVLYGADITLPGLLHGFIVRSAVPSGKIARIDVERARAAPGVKAVLTAADVPSERFGYGVKDELSFASEKIRYAGEPIAAVAATDEQAAEAAARLIEIDYEETRGTFDVLDAIRADAPLVHEDMAGYEPNRLVTREWKPRANTNIVHRTEFARGDTERAFREAEHVFEDTFRTKRVHHGYMEPHACVARVEGDKITVWTSTQKAFIVRATLADIFGVPEGSIRIICTKIGGGFGGKNGVRLEHYAVALALNSGRPVRVVMRRGEEFTASAGSVPAAIVLKTSVARDGTITARQAEFFWDCGAYTDGLPASNRALKDAAGPYRIPNIHVTSNLVYTNTMRGCPFRGLGVPEATWAGESQMDMIAHRLGLDPVEFRMRNLLDDGDVSPNGDVVDGVMAKECLRRAADEIGYGKAGARDGDHAIGLSMVYKTPTGAGGSSSAVVSIQRDGSVQVLVGSSDVGGGMETAVAQIAAEELGVEVGDVGVASADTATVPFDHGTYSSRVLVSTGTAVLRAAADARAELLKVAGEILDEEPASLTFRQKKIYRRSGAEAATVEAIFRDRRCRRKNIVATASFVDDGQKSGWRFGAQAVEVALDRETGGIEVLRVISVHDVGKAVNPPLVVGQLEGGIVMGLGYALAEELSLDDGRILNTDFSDYAMPFAEQVPPIKTILLESPLADGPFGAKGVGEIGLFAVAPAIGNALHNACGVRMTELPMRPDRVLAALEAAARR